MEHDPQKGYAFQKFISKLHIGDQIPFNSIAKKVGPTNGNFPTPAEINNNLNKHKCMTRVRRSIWQREFLPSPENCRNAKCTLAESGTHSGCHLLHPELLHPVTLKSPY